MHWTSLWTNYKTEPHTVELHGECYNSELYTGTIPGADDGIYSKLSTEDKKNMIQIPV